MSFYYVPGTVPGARNITANTSNCDIRKSCSDTYRKRYVFKKDNNNKNVNLPSSEALVGFGIVTYRSYGRQSQLSEWWVFILTCF